MQAFKKLWCAILVRFGRDHAWRRPRKAEHGIGPVKICDRCGATKAITKRVKLRAVKGEELVKVVGGAS